MSRYRLEITLDEATLVALDGARGHEPRASFVKRVLGEALGSGRRGEVLASRRAPDPAPSKPRPVVAPAAQRGSPSPSLSKFMSKGK
jgi:hypothetical protein